MVDGRYGGMEASESAFQQRKKVSLLRLKEARLSGHLDEGIDGFLDIVNSHPDLVTTSSCWGRVGIMATPKLGDKRRSTWLMKDHSGLVVDDAIASIELIRGGTGDLTTIHDESVVVSEDTGIFLIQQSPILHLFVSDIHRAMEVRDMGRSAGCKESGIRAVRDDRVVLEIRCTEHLQMPVGWGRSMMTDMDHLRRSIVLANDLLGRAQGKYREFFELLK